MTVTCYTNCDTHTANINTHAYCHARTTNRYSSAYRDSGTADTICSRMALSRRLATTLLPKSR